MSENSILLNSDDSETGYSGQTIAKHFTENLSTGNFTLICHHKLRRRQDILLHGVIVAGQCYTHPLRLLDFPIDHPLATIYNSCDPQFAKDVFAGTVNAVAAYQEHQLELLDDALSSMSMNYRKVSVEHYRVYSDSRLTCSSRENALASAVRSTL